MGVLALREVFLGNCCFTDIALNTGAPRDRLAARLKSWSKQVSSNVTNTPAAPARFDYHLTPACRALAPVMRVAGQLGNSG